MESSGEEEDVSINEGDDSCTLTNSSEEYSEFKTNYKGKSSIS